MISLTESSYGATQHERVRLIIHGTVQGIGFRPLVFGLARELSLGGWTANTAQGVMVELEGPSTHLSEFQERLLAELPRTGIIQSMTSCPIPPLGEQEFFIRPGQPGGQHQSVLSPDSATCHDCLQDIHDPHSRRYRYPFTTCARCGPRYSIVRSLPYDRRNTTMAGFSLCPECRQEFHDPCNRRFHAETLSCPACGPELVLWDKEGKTVASKDEAWPCACHLLANGSIVAVKGLGGFHLWVNALNREALQRLRTRKHRPDKPFAVLFPTLQVLRTHCLPSPEEEWLLSSPAAPIVIVRTRNDSSIVSEVAPGNPYLGALLPYTPLHHLMMGNLGFPVVATSGNRSEESLVYDEREAMGRLGDLADAFLIHNRPIVRPVDDSVVRIINGKRLMLRRARGYVPTPLALSSSPEKKYPYPTILAMGGHLKNTIALMHGEQIIASQHIGDLSTVEATTLFEKTMTDFLKLHDFTPHAITCDTHPDYHSTRFARTFGARHHLPVIPVQHHHAHIAACMAEHQLTGPVLGVAWDGAGYESDGTLWGGEFLLCDEHKYKRVGYLRPFPLPGGEICMREPRRVALSLLYEIFGNGLVDLDLPPLQSFGPDRTRLLATMIQRNLNCPMTSSIGRLFDGVSALIGLSLIATFEGQAAMALEFLADSAVKDLPSFVYHLPIHPVSQSSETIMMDWQSMIKEILYDLHEEQDHARIAWKFHQALARVIVDIAERIGCPQVVLSGGVFQNTLLLTLTDRLLTSKGFQVFIPERFGPNDGGLSIGQCLVAVHQFKNRHEAKSLTPEGNSE